MGKNWVGLAYCLVWDIVNYELIVWIMNCIINLIVLDVTVSAVLGLGLGKLERVIIMLIG